MEDAKQGQSTKIMYDLKLKKETALMKNISNFFVKSIEDILLYDPENSIEFLVMTMFETILKAERSCYLARIIHEQTKKTPPCYCSY